MRYGSRCSFRLPDKDRYNRCRDDRPSNQPASDHCGRPLFEMPERMRKRMVDKEMINGENGKMLRNDPYEIRLMQNLYDAAVKQLSLKFEILNNEFKVLTELIDNCEIVDPKQADFYDPSMLTDNIFSDDLSHYDKRTQEWFAKNFMKQILQ